MNLKTNWFKSNPQKTILITLLLLIVIILSISEIIVRVYTNYNLSYYVVIRKNINNTILSYPYGKIIINKYGFPDKDFSNIKSKPRIAYVGDSICYGVGAGYGYRISDIIQKEINENEQMNMSYGIGEGISIADVNTILKYAKDFQLDKVVYLMNLNDILPTEKTTNAKELWIAPYKKYLDWMRGESYLYTYIRLLIKNYYVRLGYNGNGYKAFELYPKQNEYIIAQTTERIVILYNRLKQMGIELIVVIIPYEMQISSDAERTYSKLGIKWSPEFIDRGPQKIIAKRLMNENIKVIDAYYAFIQNDSDEAEKERNNIKVGEFFVYNKGDKLDWNHPNRAGHKKIAEFLLTKYKDCLKIGPSYSTLK
jgi:hypothetical protein